MFHIYVIELNGKGPTSYYYYQCWTANLGEKGRRAEVKKMTWVMSEGVKTRGHSGNTEI